MCAILYIYISALHQYGSLYYSNLSTLITCRFNWERLGRCWPLREGSWWSKRCWRVAEGGTLVAKPAVGSTVLPQGSVKLGIWKCIESEQKVMPPLFVYIKKVIFPWNKCEILKHTVFCKSWRSHISRTSRSGSWVLAVGRTLADLTGAARSRGRIEDWRCLHLLSQESYQAPRKGRSAGCGFSLPSGSGVSWLRVFLNLSNIYQSVIGIVA